MRTTTKKFKLSSDFSRSKQRPWRDNINCVKIKKLLPKIHLQYGVGGELYGYPKTLERQTNGSWSRLSLKHSRRQTKNTKQTNKQRTEDVLLWAYHKMEGFFGNDNNARKNRRQQEKRKRIKMD